MECDGPIYIKYDQPKGNAKDGWVYGFPSGCGKCLPCLMKRKSQWSLRLVEQMRNSFSAYFVTLTYDNKYLPFGDDGYSANKNDHTHFIKWLKYYENEKVLSKRKAVSLEEDQRRQLKIKSEGNLAYYGVIEYGAKYGRPHFHYILFNVVDTYNIGNAWSSQIKISRGVYAPGFNYGKIDIQECNVNTIDYVLKYMVKPYQEENESKQREVSFMSKGLGKTLATPEIINHIKRPEGNSLLNSRGTKVGIPRYFQKLFLSEEEREKKSKYIQKQKDSKDKWKEDNYKRLRINQSLVELNAIANRSNSLKNTQKRNLK